MLEEAKSNRKKKKEVGILSNPKSRQPLVMVRQQIGDELVKEWGI